MTRPEEAGRRHCRDGWANGELVVLSRGVRNGWLAETKQAEFASIVALAWRDSLRADAARLGSGAVAKGGFTLGA